MKLIYAFRFLTIFRIPWKEGEDLSQVAHSAALFPLVGLFIGGFLLLITLAASCIWSSLTVAALVVVAWIIVTGGLHLDGLADLADGMLGGKDREECLLIMQDSRIGAFGVLAILAVVILKIVFILELPGSCRIWVILIAPVGARWFQVLALAAYPAAKDEGLGHFFKNHLRRREIFIALGIALIGSLLFLQWQGFVLLAGTTLILLIPASILSAKLGGLTGDIYGSLTELFELVFIVGASFLPCPSIL
jgi:adenosylcobinamide-GDP ribazoletransferase